MKTTAQKLILVSFILAVVATLAFFLYLESIKTPEVIPVKTTILVASETIPPRTLIDKKMLIEIQVSEDSIFGSYIKDSSEIIGKYTKETIFANEGFNINKLQDKDGNELSLKIANNNRAVSISVTGDSGVSSLLKPGDYVDVVSYIAEKKDIVNEVRIDKAKIILQKVEVLAVDKQLNREVKDTAKPADNQNQKAISNFLVTLSIPTSEVEKLILAESLGSLKLTLRPLKDDSTTKSDGATFESIYSDPSKINVAADQKDDKVVSNQTDNASKVITSKTGTSKTSSTSTKKYTSYTIKRGDSLREISQKFYGDRSKYTIIMGANSIKDENYIKAGEVIKIPILK